MKTPTASVLMCVFNEREQFLRQAIESVLAQSFGDFEFIIVDDGSSAPETLQTLARYEADDPRITVFHKTNEGLTRSLNFGLAHCSAPVVFRHDSDDWSDVWRLASQVYFMSEYPDVAVVGTGFHCCLEDGQIFSTIGLPQSHADIQAALPSGNVFCHGSVGFRKAAIDAVGGYRESLPCAQDYDLFWRVSERFPTANLPEPLYSLRRTSSCITASKTLLQDRCSECIRELARMRRETGREDFARAWARAGVQVETPHGRMKALLRSGDQFLVAGSYGLAMRQYFAAGIASPWQWRVYGKIARLGLCLAMPSRRHELFLPRRIVPEPAPQPQPQVAA
jgi:hypothetical protein